MPRKTYEVILDVGGDTLPIRASSYESLVRHFLRTLFCEALVRSRRPKLDRATPDLWGGYTAALETFNTICQEQGLRFDSGNALIIAAVQSLPLQRLSNMCRYALDWAKEEIKCERAWRWGTNTLRSILAGDSTVRRALPDNVAVEDLKAEHLFQDIEYVLDVQNGDVRCGVSVAAGHPASALVLWSFLMDRLPLSPGEVTTWSRYPSDQRDRKRSKRVRLWRRGGDALVDAGVYLHLAQMMAQEYPSARLYTNPTLLNHTAIAQLVGTYVAGLPPVNESPQEVYFEGRGVVGKLTFGETNGLRVPTRLTLVHGTPARVFSAQKVDGKWDLCWTDVSLPDVPTPSSTLSRIQPPVGWSDAALVEAHAQTLPCKMHGGQYVGMQPVSAPKYNDIYRQWLSGVQGALSGTDSQHLARRMGARSWVLTGVLLGLRPPETYLCSEHTRYPSFAPPGEGTLGLPPTPKEGLPFILQVSNSGQTGLQTLYFKSREGMCAKLQDYVTFDPEVPFEVAAARQGVVFWAWHAETGRAQQQVSVSDLLRDSVELRWAARISSGLHSLWFRCPGSKMYLRTKNWSIALSSGHARFTKGDFTGVLRDGVWEHISRPGTDELYQELVNEAAQFPASSEGVRGWDSSQQTLMLGVHDRSLETRLLGLRTGALYETSTGLLCINGSFGTNVAAYDKRTKEVRNFQLLGDTLLCGEEDLQWLQTRVGNVPLTDIKISDGTPGSFEQRCNLMEVLYTATPKDIQRQGAIAHLPEHTLVAIRDQHGAPWLHVKLPTGEIRSTQLEGVSIRHDVVKLVADASKAGRVSYTTLTKPLHLEQATAAVPASEYVSGLVRGLESDIRKAGSGYLAARGRDGLLYALHLREEEGAWYNCIHIDHGSDKLTLLRDIRTQVWYRSGVELPVPLEDILLQAFQRQQANPGAWLRQHLLEALNQEPTTPENREQGKQEEMAREMEEVEDRTFLAHVEAAAAASAQDLSPTAEPPPAGNEQTTPSGEGTKDENMPTDKDKANDKTLAEKAKAAAAAAATEAKENATEAAWRTAASQLVKLTRDPLAAVIQRHLGPEDESIRKKIADFLTTEAGTAMLAGVLALGLSTLPQNERTAQLARQLRIKAMADMGDLAADVLMGPLRQVVSSYLQGDAPEAPAAPPMLGPATPLESQLHGETTMASASLLD